MCHLGQTARIAHARICDRAHDAVYFFLGLLRQLLLRLLGGADKLADFLHGE